jgi:hypothetical protein
VRTPRKLNAMNFSFDYTEKKSPPLPRIVPLLVLVKEWSELGGDAFDQVDVVLLLLQGIRAVGEGKVGALYLELFVVHAAWHKFINMQL